MAWMEELRARYGTDTAIAARSGIDKTRLSRWARGDVRGGITLTNLVRLADVSEHTLGDMLMAFYGVDPGQLVPTAPVATLDGSLVTVDGDRVVRIGTGKTYRMLLLLDDPDDPGDPGQAEAG